MNDNIYEQFTTHLLNDKKPSIYFNNLNTESFKEENRCLNLWMKLKKIEQNPKYHPEGSVWNHTMYVIDLAARVKDFSYDQQAFMWASLLHDIGKSTTTRVKRGRIISYNHDVEGEKLSEKLLNSYTNDHVFIQKVTSLVRWHMQPFFVAKDLPFADIPGIIRDTRPSEVGLFSFCDRLGRGKITVDGRNEALKTIEKFYDVCIQVVKEDKEIDRIMFLKEKLTTLLQ